MKRSTRRLRLIWASGARLIWASRARLAWLAAIAILAALLVPLGPLSTESPAVADAAPGPDHASEVAIFFYPWYNTPAVSGAWAHWDQGGYVPPDNIGSNFYPARGPYSSADPAVITDQMQQIAAAGVDTIIVSWWGQGSYEDSVLKQILQPAAQVGLKVAVHIEPYDGRSAKTVQNDFAYLRAEGIRDFYIYQAQSLAGTAMKTLNDAYTDDAVYAEDADEQMVRNGAFMQWAQVADFTGIYTYDPRGFAPEEFGSICADARSHNLLCLPSVGPGWNATRATSINAVVNRNNGAVYDQYWQAAIDARADIVTVTSYNEWHEGTQIEPAAPQCIAGSSYCYSDYEGAYGLHGADASTAYLAETLRWSTIAKGHAPSISERLLILASALSQNNSDVVGRFKAMAIQPAPVPVVPPAPPAA